MGIYLYLPYVLGMIFAMIAASKTKQWSKQHEIGLAGSLGILLYFVDYFRPVSLEFFKSTLNSFC